MATVNEECVSILPDELLPPDPDGLYEFVDDEWKEKGMGGESSWINGQIFFLLRNFLQQSPIGYLFGPECSYACFPEDSKKFRRPDLSFVRKGRFPDEKIPQGRLELAPDLVVEVVSPHDTYVDIEARLDDFRRVGVPLMWVVNPADKTVKIYCEGNLSPEVRTVDGTLDAGDVLPGWSCPIREFFPQS